MQENPRKMKTKIKKMLRFKKKNPLLIPVVKNTIYNPTQIPTSQILTDIKNKSQQNSTL